MKHIVFIIMTLMVFSTTNAQSNIFGVDDDILEVKESIRGTFSIGFVPQYAITQGMRIDLDFKIATNQFITIGPQWYFAKNSQRFAVESADFSGAGINLNYRYFLGKSDLPSGAYLGAGLHYKYLNVEYDDYNWTYYSEYGNTYQNEQYGTQDIAFNQGGYDLLMGYQYAFNRFFVDFYLGWAFRLSDYDSDTDGSTWSQTIFDPGFSGFMPVAGFRVGILIR